MATRKECKRNFGHATDHHVLYVTVPFSHVNMKNKGIISSVKLQICFIFHGIDNSIDNTTALTNISFDASFFLPRCNTPDSELPQFIPTYILPEALFSAIPR